MSDKEMLLKLLNEKCLNKDCSSPEYKIEHAIKDFLENEISKIDLKGLTYSIWCNKPDRSNYIRCQLDLYNLDTYYNDGYSCKSYILSVEYKKKMARRDRYYNDYIFSEFTKVYIYNDNESIKECIQQAVDMYFEDKQRKNNIANKKAQEMVAIMKALNVEDFYSAMYVISGLNEMRYKSDFKELVESELKKNVSEVIENE